jgi:hypothetical protein
VSEPALVKQGDKVAYKPTRMGIHKLADFPDPPAGSWLAEQKIPSVSMIEPRLEQGMRPSHYAPYDLIVNCEQHLARRPMEGYTGGLIHIPFVDSDDTDIPAVMIHAAVDAIARVLASGGWVLVHCTGGLNRSSLVSGAYLVRRGMTGREAIEALRERRSQHALTTRAFERWVASQ